MPLLRHCITLLAKPLCLLDQYGISCVGLCEQPFLCPQICTRTNKDALKATQSISSVH